MMDSFLARFRSVEPRLREASAADAADCARLHAEGFARGWGAAEFESLLADRTVRAHVAYDGHGGGVLGFVLSRVVLPEAEVLSIAVAPARRGLGIGRLLHAHHLARLAAEGVTTSFLEVETGNAAALKLYAGLGYVEAGRRKGYYGQAGGAPAADAVLMRRDF